MNKICNDISKLNDKNIFDKLEKKYSFKLNDDIKEFFKLNNGGTPIKSVVTIDEDDYEIRSFVSFNENENNSAFASLDYFQNKTKGKIVPLAFDSGDNYYCINLSNNKIYYWDHSENLYYELTDSFADLISYII